MEFDKMISAKENKKVCLILSAVIMLFIFIFACIIYFTNKYEVKNNVVASFMSGRYQIIKNVEDSSITYDLFDCKNNKCINSDIYEYFDDKNNLQIYVNGYDGGSVIDYFGVTYQYKTMIHPNGNWVDLK